MVSRGVSNSGLCTEEDGTMTSYFDPDDAVSVAEIWLSEHPQAPISEWPGPEDSWT